MDERQQDVKESKKNTLPIIISVIGGIILLTIVLYVGGMRNRARRRWYS